jgi:hypothetical protein
MIHLAPAPKYDAFDLCEDIHSLTELRKKPSSNT